MGLDVDRVWVTELKARAALTSDGENIVVAFQKAVKDLFEVHIILASGCKILLRPSVTLERRIQAEQLVRQKVLID